VSHATLDLQNSQVTDDDIVQVWVNTDDTNHLLCNLGKNASHVPLDLAFSEGETIAFFSKGQGTVHLTGFLLPEEPDYDLGGFGEEGDESVSEDEEDNVLNKSPPKKQKAKKNKVAANEKQQEDDDEDEDDSDFDANVLDLDDADSDDDDDDDDEDDDEDDDDEDEDEDDSDENEEEDKIAAPPAKVPKLDKAAKQKQNGLSNGKPSKEQQNKKDQKQNQSQNQSQKKPQNQPEKQKPATKTLSSGVVVEDLRPGKGNEARPGKKVQVYYEGRLKSNNKVFDSTKGGEGFEFILGRGEVIRGWDIGVAGMKIGGKRRITCPPHAAYGAKGSPPVIPSNATLVFDVELRGVN